MIQSRRKPFHMGTQVSQASHAGLWLDKFLVHQTKSGASVDAETGTPGAILVKETAGIPVSPLYSQFYSRWQETLHALGARCRTAQARGRMVVGLGAESVLETAVTLHRTYGVPYIPGSALKGLAARFVRERLAGEHWGCWQKNDNTWIWQAGKDYRTLFGDTDSAGYITFFDALYVPNSGHEGRPLWPDIITVHHKDYYQQGTSAPADWDSPTPIPFLSATGCYLIALDGQVDWVEQTFEILGHAMREMGVGAKTSSGYGRMELEEAQAEPVDPAQPEVDALLQRIDDLAIKDVASGINALYQAWQQLAAPDHLRRQIAQALLDKVAAAGRQKKSAEKAWYRDLVEFVQSQD
jgi:CRISPR-associated protein Cmr6